MSHALDQATADRICQLADRVGRLKEFDTIRGMRIREKGQKPENNMRRGLGTSLLTGVGLSPVAGAVNAHNYRVAGQVYRKRDAAADALVGSAAGVGAFAGNSALDYAITGGRSLSPFGNKVVGATSIITGLGASYLASRAMANRRLRKLQGG